MGSNLITVYEFNTLFPNLADLYAATEIDAAIETATGILETLCDRVFSTTEYRDWYDLSNPIFLHQYPVTRIKLISPVRDVGYIQYSNANSYSATWSKDSDHVYLWHMNAAGSETTVEIDIASNAATLTTLETQVELNNGWSMVLQGTDYNMYPTILIRPATVDAIEQNHIFVADKQGMSGRIEGERTLLLNDTCYYADSYPQSVLVQYIAGYTVSVDNTGHTALTTTGNVPSALKSCVAGIVAEVLNYTTADNVITGSYKSETLGDYSYTLAEGGESYTAFVQKVSAKYGDVIGMFKKNFI